MVTIPLLHLFISSYGWRIALQLIAAVILASCLIFCIPLCPLPSTTQEEEEHGEEKESLRKNSKTIDSKDDKIVDLNKSGEGQEESKFAKVLEFAKKPEAWVYFIATAGTMSGWSFYFVNVVSLLSHEQTNKYTDKQTSQQNKTI